MLDGNCDIHLDMLGNLIYPQLEKQQPAVVLQQDETPPHGS